MPLVNLRDSRRMSLYQPTRFQQSPRPQENVRLTLFSLDGETTVCRRFSPQGETYRRFP
ncbi:MAG: hypothetical protein OXI54_16645 [Chloroflexota bacterium]|nr:hypothetical protein [Chloroflexota bacterium]MDE2685756.1 hypothetical protein [Chloroflexota bacterium]